ncbi:MAG: hypothetical protein R3E02_11375 [Blastomonas sp.]
MFDYSPDGTSPPNTVTLYIRLADTFAGWRIELQVPISRKCVMPTIVNTPEILCIKAYFDQFRTRNPIASPAYIR